MLYLVCDYAEQGEIFGKKTAFLKILALFNSNLPRQQNESIMTIKLFSFARV